MPPTSTAAPLAAAPAAAQPPLALSLQILRLKAKALRLRGELDASDDDDDGEKKSSFERHLRRRLFAVDDACVCGESIDASPEGEEDDEDEDEDEFRAADGAFKLPRLLHPVLERQHAVLRLKREASMASVRPAAASRAPAVPASSSRVVPCVIARAIALRFVQ